MKYQFEHDLNSNFRSNTYSIAKQEGYIVKSADDQEVYNAVRNTNSIRTFIALMLGFMASLAFTVAGIIIFLQNFKSSNYFFVFYIYLLLILAAYPFFSIVRLIGPVRVIYFYKGLDKRNLLFEIWPTSPWFFIKRSYHLIDKEKRLVIILKSNYVFSLFKRRWDCFDKENNFLFSAEEHFLSILAKYFRIRHSLTNQFLFSLKDGMNIGRCDHHPSFKYRYLLTCDHKIMPNWMVISSTILLDGGLET